MTASVHFRRQFSSHSLKHDCHLWLVWHSIDDVGLRSPVRAPRAVHRRTTAAAASAKGYLRDARFPASHERVVIQDVGRARPARLELQHEVLESADEDVGLTLTFVAANDFVVAVRESPRRTLITTSFSSMRFSSCAT